MWGPFFPKSARETGETATVGESEFIGLGEGRSTQKRCLVRGRRDREVGERNSLVCGSVVRASHAAASGVASLHGLIAAEGGATTRFKTHAKREEGSGLGCSMRWGKRREDGRVREQEAVKRSGSLALPWLTRCCVGTMILHDKSAMITQYLIALQ